MTSQTKQQSRFADGSFGGVAALLAAQLAAGRSGCSIPGFHTVDDVMLFMPTDLMMRLAVPGAAPDRTDEKVGEDEVPE